MAKGKKEGYVDWLKEEFITVQVSRDTITLIAEWQLQDEFGRFGVHFNFSFVFTRLPTTHIIQYFFNSYPSSICDINDNG